MDRSVDKQKLVSSLVFGSSVAEDERDALSDYFVETDVWKQVWGGSKDVILAPKGGGKSAIYSMLVGRQEQLAANSIGVIPAENPQGAPALRSLVSDDTTEEQFKEIWLIYFFALISNHLESIGGGGSAARKLRSILSEAGLLRGGEKRRPMLKSIIEFVKRKLNPSKVEGTVLFEPMTGTPISVSTSAEYADSGHSAGSSKMVLDSTDLLDLADEALSEAQQRVWICLDRLDAAFAASPDIEKTALRALFRAYLDLMGSDWVSLKIFLRSDIWKDISDGGFREASHIVRKSDVKWNEASLRQLVVRRLISSNLVVENYGIDRERALVDSEYQKSVLSAVFPAQIDSGSGKTKTFFGWCMNHTRDGLGQNAPREMIALFKNARDSQVKRFETGEWETVDRSPFHPKAFVESADYVSRDRLHSTIFAEYPDVRGYLEKLNGEKATQNRESFQRIWGVGETEVEARVKRLESIGLLERLTEGWRVPFLYRPALEVVQGAAPEVRSR